MAGKKARSQLPISLPIVEATYHKFYHRVITASSIPLFSV